MFNISILSRESSYTRKLDERTMKHTMRLIKTTILALAVALLLCTFTNAYAQTGVSQSTQKISSSGYITPAISTQRPHVNGSKIMLNGEEFVPIGVIKGWDIVYYPPNAPVPTNWPDETEGVYNLLNNTKFNVVMLSENRWLWENDPNYIPALHHIIDLCKARGLYVIIRYYSWSNRNYSSPDYDYDPFDHTEDMIKMITEPTGWLNHIVSIAQEFKNDSNVIGIDPLNEPPAESKWIPYGYTAIQAQSIWHNNALKVIDAIHSVDLSYLIFIPPNMRELDFQNSTPWNRPNIVYIIHWYYGWDTEWGNPYADAYWNAVTEEDFAIAYSKMQTYCNEQFFSFRDTYNVPVMNGETSLCKISWKSGSPCNNTEREFQDQIHLGAQNKFGQLYWQMDRNVSPHYWGLLDANNLEQWSDGGVLVRDAVNEYYP